VGALCFSRGKQRFSVAGECSTVIMRFSAGLEKSRVQLPLLKQGAPTTLGMERSEGESYLRLATRLFLAAFLTCFRAAALRLLASAALTAFRRSAFLRRATSSGEYMVLRQLPAPQ
jgi:hypothetical protein